MNFILVPLHTDTLDTASYSDNTYFYVYAAFFNVLLTYGMETSFFRFFSKTESKSKVFSTTLITLSITTIIVFGLVFIFNYQIAESLDLRIDYFNYLVGVIALDTLVVAPFAYLRATGRPIKFTAIKLSNIAIYVALINSLEVIFESKTPEFVILLADLQPEKSTPSTIIIIFKLFIILYLISLLPF